MIGPILRLGEPNYMYQPANVIIILQMSWRQIGTSHQQPSWASYEIRKIAGCACAGNAGNVFPRHRLQRKPLVSNPDMHHGTCVTHVPWCMSGSLTRGGGENVPGIPGACANLNIFGIWQEARGDFAHASYHATQVSRNSNETNTVRERSPPLLTWFN